MDKFTVALTPSKIKQASFCVTLFWLQQNLKYTFADNQIKQQVKNCWYSSSIVTSTKAWKLCSQLFLLDRNASIPHSFSMLWLALSRPEVD